MDRRGTIRAGRRALHGGKRLVASQRGASFPLALLLFLVCALLSSVIISASSAAAGRQSQLAEMEQRYYGVTSAAELVKRQFEDAVVHVECSKTVDVAHVDGYSGAGASASTSETPGTTTLSIGAVTVEGSNRALTNVEKQKLSLPELSALYLLQGSGSDTVNLETAWDNARFDTFGAFDAATFSLTAGAGAESSLDEDALAPLAVSLRERFGADGMLRFVISPAAPDAGASAGSGDDYTLTLVCACDVDTVETSAEERQAPSVSSDGAGVERTTASTVTTTRASTVRFTPVELLVGDVMS